MSDKINDKIPNNSPESMENQNYTDKVNNTPDYHNKISTDNEPVGLEDNSLEIDKEGNQHTVEQTTTTEDGISNRNVIKTTKLDNGKLKVEEEIYSNSDTTGKISKSSTSVKKQADGTTKVELKHLDDKNAKDDLDKDDLTTDEMNKELGGKQAKLTNSKQPTPDDELDNLPEEKDYTLPEDNKNNKLKDYGDNNLKDLNLNRHGGIKRGGITGEGGVIDKVKNSKAVTTGKNIGTTGKNLGANIKDLANAKKGERLANLKKLGSQLGKDTKNCFKGTRIEQKVKMLIEKIRKIVQFIVSNGKIIAIISAIVGIILLVAPFVISIVQTIGKTPHYYCEVPGDDGVDEGIKNSALYQQYCATGGSSLNLEDMNGHYIVQDQSGPCTACCTMNMTMRYFAANGINIYDYMWDDSGEYVNKLDDVTVNQHASSAYIADGCTESDNWYNIISQADNTSQSNGTNEPWPTFAAKHGYKRTLQANWGYYYSDDIWDNGTDSVTAARENDKWTWDLSYGSPGHWYADMGTLTGTSITIDGVTCTYTFVGAAITKNELITLLENHPSGVCVCGHRSTGGGHGILISKYDATEDKFYVIDSGKYLGGGFEGPADSNLFCCYSGENPNGNIIFNNNQYWYIEEDENTPTN